jgi:vacuolar-type H+-ATPase subunit H
VAEPYLRDTLGAWYGRLQGAYDYLQRVGSIRESRAEATDERVGQLVVFPTVEYPAFLLQNAYFATEGETIVEATLSDLSSDQELSNAPTTINYTSESRERYLSLGALFDARADAATQLALNFSVTDVPLAIEEGLDSLGFALFEGSAEIDASFTKAETTTGSATIEISVPSLQGGQGGNTVGLLVRDVLAARETISITVAFMVDEDGSLSLERSSTNLDDALSDVVTARVDAAIAEAREELANALEGFLNPYLEQASTALDGVVDVETDAAELLRLARDREAAALAARNLASDVVQGYRNELEREAQERIDQAQQEAQEAAERAAEEARGEAEDAVEDQVDELRRRLPLPGF